MSPIRSAPLLAIAALLSACTDPSAFAAPQPVRRAVSEPPAPAPPPPPAPRPPCPPEMALVEGHCIDRHEAHLVVRAIDSASGERVHPPHDRPQEGIRYEARSRAGVFPQAYISRPEAQAACENAGKRLCTRAEWQRACRGAAARVYPYGDRPEQGRCNKDKQHLLTLYFGPYPSRWTYRHFNDPALDQQPGFLARTGAHQGCVSDEGVFDLVGNLHEWVSDTADRAMVGKLKGEGVLKTYQPWAPGNGVFMGGFFSTREEHGPGCLFTTIAHEAAYHDYSTGFRCCAEPR